MTHDWSPHHGRRARHGRRAARHGGRDRVFRALLSHPLIGQIDLAEGLTDRLLHANRDHLAWAR